MKKIITIILAAFAFSSISAEKEKTAQEIAEIFSDNERVPDYSYALLYIDNLSPSGEVTEHMIVNEYGGWHGEDLKSLVVEFKSPADKKICAFFSLKKKEKMTTAGFICLHSERCAEFRCPSDTKVLRANTHTTI